ERVRMDTQNLDSISDLAYVYNIGITIGAALITASAFHNHFRTDEEIGAIRRIDAEVRDLDIKISELLEEQEAQHVSKQNLASDPGEHRTGYFSGSVRRDRGNGAGAV